MYNRYNFVEVLTTLLENALQSYNETDCNMRVSTQGLRWGSFEGHFKSGRSLQA